MKMFQKDSRRTPGSQKQLTDNHKLSPNQPILKTSLKIISEFILIKDAKLDTLNNFSRMFFVLGLCISLLLTITAFEWKFYGEGNLVDWGGMETDFEVLFEVPVTDLTPPPPKIIQPQIIEIINDDIDPEDLAFDFDIEITEEMLIEEPEEGPQIISPIDDRDYLIKAEKQPEPNGGLIAFYEYVSKNLKYPALARRNGIEGKVYVRFVVDKDGTLIDVECMKGIGAGCDEEAIKVIENAEKWISGKQRGRPVRVQIVLPIHFRLK